MTNDKLTMAEFALLLVFAFLCIGCVLFLFNMFLLSAGMMEFIISPIFLLVPIFIIAEFVFWIWDDSPLQKKSLFLHTAAMKLACFAFAAFLVCGVFGLVNSTIKFWNKIDAVIQANAMNLFVGLLGIVIFVVFIEINMQKYAKKESKKK